jgi:serine/threonine protein kinase
MSLPAGTRLGPYSIVAPIGAGGMGEVYRARDTRLGREVAIKLLSRALAVDASHRARFEQEARATSALNHPNIVAVYDVGLYEERLYVVTELLEGQTLRDRLKQGPLRQRASIDYAVSVSRGLSAAHAKGIIHRDLKPENIFLTRDGGVKILDFGLAKLIRPAASAENASSVPTQALDTDPGLVLGTVGYMSPEQVRGHELDQRSDIFSFGIVLYETLACGRAFAGDSAADTMSAILNQDPPDLPESVGLGVHLIVRRCLDKDPDHRFQTMLDLTFALEAIGATSAASGPVPPAALPVSRWRPSIWLPVAAAFAAGLLGASLLFQLASRQPRGGVRGISFAQLTDDSGEEVFPSLSPDGKTLAYSSKSDGHWNIFEKGIGERDAVDLSDRSHKVPYDDTQPAFSPDGRSIAFRSDRESGGIFVMNHDGIGIHRVADSGYNPSWSPDGKSIVYSEESITRPEDRQLALSCLWVVEVASGKKNLLRQTDAVQPRWSPHGDRIAYWAIDRSGHRDIWTMTANGGDPVAVTKDHPYVDWNPVWSPDGKYLYFASDRGRAMNVWRVPIHEKSGRVLGAPEPVTTPSPYSAHLDFSRDGRRLAFVQYSVRASVKKVRFDPFTQSVLSEPVDVTPDVRQATRPSLSPDGQWVAFGSSGPREDIYIVHADGSTMRQLTADGVKNRGPQFSPDGKSIAFFSKRTGTPEIWTIGTDGSDARQVTFLAGPNVAWPIWSPDGKRLIYTIFGVNSFLLDMTKPWTKQQPEALPHVTGAGQFYAWSWSPDARKLAGFEQREDGSSAGVVEFDLGSRTFTKVSDFGADPVWLSDSQRILMNHRGRLYLLEGSGKAPREILSLAPYDISPRGFSVSRDDRTIYFSVATTEADIWMATFDGK